jgi:DNA-binding CsgD family transcriptional regulator
VSLQMAKPTPKAPMPLGKSPGRRLTQAELGLLLALRAEGKTQVEIAQRLDCDQTAVSKALKRLGQDTTQLASHHLKSRSYSIARRLTSIAEKSENDDHAIKAAKTVLAGAGVIQSGQQVTVNAAVMIAQPGKPETWGPEPVFEGELLGESPTASSEDNAKK